MRVVEKITGTAGCYLLTGTVSCDDRGRLAARERFAATVTSFAWRPVVVLVAGQGSRVHRESAL